MSMRFTAKARRGMVALAVVAGLGLGSAACGGGGGDDKKPQSTSSTATAEGSQPDAQEGKSEEPLAELKGPGGLLLTVTSAVGDSGGFVTVNGELKNDGSEVAVIPVELSGNETEIMNNGRSLGGATLVDSKSKKRYYVLRDTEGRPLTTTGFSTLKAGESIDVFLQFPAPPASSTDVTFSLPLFPSAVIKISG
ncbi:hypothetical protein [Streptomyces antibioticus]|uniref:Secreted protein n=1 Tax=Streptomyces antibioticus TaxID=1890 RepID=A0AAE6YBH7_STRAT|nr:hypothetical protein [Streptomyces antibioticus]MBO7935407.1 hypothetical protein [Streptomyces sp. S9]MCX4743365.1 hypothetical protein [Streptomyces antibioticus]OOQ49436.1 hypothetical protein AFM16_24655 [Streptomyces antibioticus]QIT46392.1 hypothetical protein HCX60_25075 [Streptomyces antibioticus]